MFQLFMKLRKILLGNKTSVKPMLIWSENITAKRPSCQFKLLLAWFKHFEIQFIDASKKKQKKLSNKIKN